MVSPCPGRCGLIQDKHCGAVVAMQKVEIFHVAHRLRQVPQTDGVAGLNVTVITGPGQCSGQRYIHRCVYRPNRDRIENVVKSQYREKMVYSSRME